jgi:hypothetical protein
LPTLTGLLQRGKDQLQTTTLIPEVWDDLGAAPLLGEGALNQVGSAHTPVMQSWAVVVKY